MSKCSSASQSGAWVGRDTGRMNSALQTVSFECLQPISHSKLPLLILVREVTFNPLKWKELHALSVAWH